MTIEITEAQLAYLLLGLDQLLPDTGAASECLMKLKSELLLMQDAFFQESQSDGSRPCALIDADAECWNSRQRLEDEIAGRIIE